MSKKTAKIYGKVASLPKNTDPNKFMTSLESNSSFMEGVKNPRNKLWYVLVEKQINDDTELHMVKFNQEGVDANQLVAQLKEFYIKSCDNKDLIKIFESIQIVGNDKFSIIKNIPDIILTENVDGNEVQRKLLSRITSDLIRLLKK